MLSRGQFSFPDNQNIDGGATTIFRDHPSPDEDTEKPNRYSYMGVVFLRGAHNDAAAPAFGHVVG